MGRSLLRDFGLPEPEPPKKVAAPQHWTCKILQGTGMLWIRKTGIHGGKLLVVYHVEFTVCVEPEESFGPNVI